MKKGDYSVLVLLVHKGVHPIRTRSFRRKEGEHNSPDLLNTRDGVKEGMIRGVDRAIARGVGLVPISSTYII